MLDDEPKLDLLIHGRLEASHGRLLLDDLYLEDELADALGARRSGFGGLSRRSWGRVWIRIASGKRSERSGG